ncbi:hypothetical protein [Dickeya zeae]|uniref:hypothetical protein n=1 Tax=Dickeya zeae TaxID=204042 RepID=UPI0012680483|nr:hypothetical protein [Dickeya zeae]MCA6986417.1 hypothetical protein [Dickeya zeae]
MASEEKRGRRNSLNKQRIINPITSTLAADDAVRLSRQPSGKRSNSIGKRLVAALAGLSGQASRHILRPPNDGQQNRPPFIPIHPRKSKMKMVKKPIMLAKTADEHCQSIPAA